MGPRLKKYCIIGVHGISQAILDALSSQCPKLKDLTLEPAGISSSKDDFVKFLHSFRYLEVLDILTTIKKPLEDELEDMDFFEEIPQDAMENDHQGTIEYAKLDASWTQQAFETITKCQHLKLSKVPFIKDAWVSALAHTFPFPFPKLTYLETYISEPALASLSRHTPHLTHLILGDNTRSACHMIASTARFEHLTWLKYEPRAASQIRGPDLLMLARNNPLLTYLLIAQDTMHKPRGVHIDDDTVAQLARCLPWLRDLALQFEVDVDADEADRKVPFAALQALGAHCPDLELLKLTYNIDWLGAPPGRVFAHLWLLQVIPRPGHGNGDGHLVMGTTGKKIALEVTAKVKGWAPLSPFEIARPNQMEEALIRWVGYMSKKIDRDWDSY